MLSVANHGAPIPAEEVDGLFQPFRRLGRDRIDRSDGHGLGLSIVRAIAHAHGASIEAAPRAEGELRVEVRFAPVTPSAPLGGS